MIKKILFILMPLILISIGGLITFTNLENILNGKCYFWFALSDLENGQVKMKANLNAQ